MPLKELGKKKEKRDFKQEFLESIAEKFGVGNAVVMEDALGEQKKQLQAAMHTHGMSLEDIAQSKKMDLGDLNKLLNQNQGSIKAVGETSPQQPQQPQQTQQGNIPASSPLGFGGASMQNGQVVEQNPGLLAGLLMTVLSGNPKTSANMDLNRLLKHSQIQRQQQLSQNQGFYKFNPMTGELEEVAQLPKGSQVRNEQVSPQERAEAYGKVSKDVAKYKTEIARESPERVQMASNIDTMDGLLTEMEEYLVSTPDVFVKGLVPWQQREFKAILDNYDKTAAIAAGGKQLTKTELELIQRTRPGLLDTGNPKAIAKKFQILRGIQKRAKERLSRGVETKGQSPNEDKWKKFLEITGRSK